MQDCEIIYVKAAKGWKWRALTESGSPQSCEETFQLYYECVLAARAKGFVPPQIKCR